jgi:DNA-binding CsgD family transcriptional regulator
MDAIDRLTARQKDCLRLVGEGYTSKEIGPRLGISYVTVDNYIRAALELLRVESRAEAARLLRARELDQPLIGQPLPLAAQPGLGSASQSTDDGGHSWLARFVPPLGGARNKLGPEAKAFAIIKVAVLSLSGLIVATIAVAVILWLLR